ncbi:hypothetical protein HAX54_003479, partial [Datura stramonium]|nr:hypothetical protein [Datura stramonium]
MSTKEARCDHSHLGVKQPCAGNLMVLTGPQWVRDWNACLGGDRSISNGFWVDSSILCMWNDLKHKGWKLR